MQVQTKKITADDFGRFGEVVSGPTIKPTAEAKEFKFWSDIASYQIEGETEIGLCTVYRQANSTVASVERHIMTPEILIPIDAPFVLPVLQNETPAADLGAFLVGLGEAVIINPGIWHGACLPVDKREASYFVIFRRGTPREDVEKKKIGPIELMF